MNPLAAQLNDVIQDANPHIMEMLSAIGKELFFPKGILSQSAEAKAKAHKLNATIGIATEGNGIMHFPSVMKSLDGVRPEESLTYAPSFGIPALRAAWKEAQYKKNPSLAGKTTSLPVVVSGITHAISMTADVWLDPGDTVIVPDLMWGNYNMILSVRKGVKLAKFEIFTQDGKFNLESFEATVRKVASENDKVVVLLNFPHNPTGYAISKTEAEVVISLLTEIADSGKNVIAMCDDAYFGLFYEEETLKESIFAKLAGTHDRILAVKLDGATKENYVWGLRVGFISYGIALKGDAAAAYEAMERKTAGCVRGDISNCSHLSQTVILKSMQDDAFPGEADEKFDILKRRATRVKEVLKDPKYADAWSVHPFNAGYFMCIRLKTVKAEPLRVHLLDKYGVGVIALGDADIRVAFSCLEESDVQTLFDTILQAIADLTA